MTLGQRIQELRKAMGLSQEGLGERLGVSRQAISKWEADGAVPEVDKLIALSRLFGVSLNALLQVELPAERAGEEDRAAEYVQTARREQRRGRAVSALLCGAFLLLAALGIWQEVRVRRLEAQADELRVITAAYLDPAVLVGAWDFQVQASNPAETVLYVSMTPAVALEGMSVSFRAAVEGLEPVTVEAQEGEGSFFSALLNLPSYKPLTLSVMFEVNGIRYIQPLAAFQVLTDKRAVWDPLWGET